MIQLYRIILCTLMTVLLATGISYGGTDELLKLIESKGFWSTYKFGTLEESELFKTKAFNLTASNYENKYDFYEADVKIDSLTTKFKIKTENSNHIMMYFTYLPNATLGEFDVLYQWCLSRYGKKYNFYENVKPVGQFTTTNREISWQLNDTVVQLSASFTINSNSPATDNVSASSGKTKYISLVFTDKSNTKINKPAVAMNCKVNLNKQSMNIFKLDDINVVIDENTGEVKNLDNTITGWKLKVSDKLYEFTKSDADSNSLHVVINRLNLKLTGETVLDNMQKTYKLKGHCKKIVPGS